jgi:hypothetical protein
MIFFHLNSEILFLTFKTNTASNLINGISNKVFTVVIYSLVCKLVRFSNKPHIKWAKLPKFKKLFG